MSETQKKRDSGAKHASAWIESSFTAESPSGSKKRRFDGHHNDPSKGKAKAPAWVASEFTTPENSPNKPLAAHPPARSSMLHITTRPNLNSFISRPTPDSKTKKQVLPTFHSAQPAPTFAIPKPPQNDRQNHTHDSSSAQVPAFRTNHAPRAVSFGTVAPKDAVSLPPPPRIEAKTPGPVLSATVQDDKEYVPLTNLITPRLFGLGLPVSGKGKARMASGDEELGISDSPFIDQTLLDIPRDDFESDAETFTMRELARGLDFSPGRKGPNKFLKGGLAARALMVITQREKDDALWHHHKTSRLKSNPGAREDLCVNVVECFRSIGETVLARCEVCPADAVGTKRALEDGFACKSRVDVVLSQPGAKGIRSVAPGTVVRLWRPWIEVDLDAARVLPPSVDGEGIDARQGTPCGRDKNECMKEGTPIRCPDDNDSRSYRARDLCPRRALLCSRFVVD